MLVFPSKWLWRDNGYLTPKLILFGIAFCLVLLILDFSLRSPNRIEDNFGS